MLEALEDLKICQRPAALFLQEVRNNREEWKGAQSTIRKLGYRAFCSSNVELGTGHNGVVTLVACTLNALQEGQISLQDSSVLAVFMDSPMLVNVHLSCRESDRAEECASISEFLGWKSGWVLAGDWNEEMHQGWVAALCAPLGVFQLPHSNTWATRWEGSRNIGYFLSSL